MFAFGLRLKIDRANVNDTGWYSCEGFNDYGHQSTSAYLLILPGRPPTHDGLVRKQIGAALPTANAGQCASSYCKALHF